MGILGRVVTLTGYTLLIAAAAFSLAFATWPDLSARTRLGCAGVGAAVLAAMGFVAWRWPRHRRGLAMLAGVIGTAAVVITIELHASGSLRLTGLWFRGSDLVWIAAVLQVWDRRWKETDEVVVIMAAWLLASAVAFVLARLGAPGAELVEPLAYAALAVPLALGRLRERRRFAAVVLAAFAVACAAAATVNADAALAFAAVVLGLLVRAASWGLARVRARPTAPPAA